MEKGLTWISVLLITLVTTVIAGGSYYLIKVQTVSPVESPGTTPPPIPTPTPTQTAQNCETQKSGQQKSDYVKGEILVGFKENVSLSQAQKIITDSRLTVLDTVSSATNLVLSVKVPEGEEFKWICNFETSPDVKYAETNNLIQIPDCSKGPC